MDRLKVLVVDDESRMRKLVRDFLVKSNFDVVEAEDGEQGDYAYQNCQQGIAVGNKRGSAGRIDQFIAAENGGDGGFHMTNLTGDQIVDGIDCQRKTDQCNGGANNDGGHQLIDPLNADKLNDQSDHYINKACEYGTDNQTGITGRNRSGTAESGEHRANEGERRT